MEQFRQISFLLPDSLNVAYKRIHESIHNILNALTICTSKKQQRNQYNDLNEANFSIASDGLWGSYERGLQQLRRRLHFKTSSRDTAAQNTQLCEGCTHRLISSFKYIIWTCLPRQSPPFMILIPIYSHRSLTLVFTLGCLRGVCVCAIWFARRIIKATFYIKNKTKYTIKPS